MARAGNKIPLGNSHTSTATRRGHLKETVSLSSSEVSAHPAAQGSNPCTRGLLLNPVEIKENNNQRKVMASQDFQHPLHHILAFPLILNCVFKVQDETFEFGFSSQWNLLFKRLFCFSVFLLVCLSFGNFNKGVGSLH